MMKEDTKNENTIMILTNSSAQIHHQDIITVTVSKNMQSDQGLNLFKCTRIPISIKNTITKVPNGQTSSQTPMLHQ